uniref:Bm7932 n=1 Tax=Brugia malayi TaxID=6279 RepID=A0A1I9G8J7_BRUMA|nr:Bm7932 [Brugia malayi]
MAKAQKTIQACGPPQLQTRIMGSQEDLMDLAVGLAGTAAGRWAQQLGRHSEGPEEGRRCSRARHHCDPPDTDSGSLMQSSARAACVLTTDLYLQSSSLGFDGTSSWKHEAQNHAGTVLSSVDLWIPGFCRSEVGALCLSTQAVISSSLEIPISGVVGPTVQSGMVTRARAQSCGSGLVTYCLQGPRKSSMVYLGGLRKEAITSHSMGSHQDWLLCLSLWTGRIVPHSGGADPRTSP